MRAELGCLPATTIKPDDNLLLGREAIMRYLNIKEDRIMDRWIDEYALPVIKRPDGYWMTTLTAIDQWICLAAKVAYANKKKSGQTTSQQRAARRERRQEREQGYITQSPKPEA